MSNQYSCGCSYNYRRSMQTEAGRQSRDSMQTEADRQSRDSMQSESVSQHRSRGLQSEMDNNCCEMDGCALAMAYVPMQDWSRPLSPGRGLEMGTIFADLNKPFCGRGGARR